MWSVFIKRHSFTRVPPTSLIVDLTVALLFGLLTLIWRQIENIYSASHCALCHSYAAIGLINPGEVYLARYVY